jgi:hypothetical protein
MFYCLIKGNRYQILNIEAKYSKDTLNDKRQGSFILLDNTIMIITVYAILQNQNDRDSGLQNWFVFIPVYLYYLLISLLIMLAKSVLE